MNDRTLPMTEHQAIWLEPSCVAKSGEDRHWCHDDAWGACEECGTPSVKYVIATEVDSLNARIQVLTYLLDFWSDESRLQTFADRERFRKEVSAALKGQGK